MFLKIIQTEENSFHVPWIFQMEEW